MYNTHQPSASVSPVEQSLLDKLPAVRPHIIHEGSFCAHRHRPSAPIGHRHCRCPLFNARQEIFRASSSASSPHWTSFGRPARPSSFSLLPTYTQSTQFPSPHTLQDFRCLIAKGILIKQQSTIAAQTNEGTGTYFLIHPCNISEYSLIVDFFTFWFFLHSSQHLHYIYSRDFTTD